MQFDKPQEESRHFAIGFGESQHALARAQRDGHLRADSQRWFAEVRDEHIGGRDLIEDAVVLYELLERAAGNEPTAVSAVATG